MLDMIMTTFVAVMGAATLIIAVVRDARASIARRAGRPTHTDPSGYLTRG